MFCLIDVVGDEWKDGFFKCFGYWLRGVILDGMISLVLDLCLVLGWE